MKNLFIIIAVVFSSLCCLAQTKTPAFRNNFELNAGVEPRRHTFLGSIGYNFSLLDDYGFYITPSIGAHYIYYIDVSLKYKFPVTKYFYITPQVSPGVFAGLFYVFPPMISFATSIELRLGENVNLSFTPRIFFLAHTDGGSAGAPGHELDINIYPPIALTMGIAF